MAVYLLATLDTKGPEAAFVRDRLVSVGLTVRLVDTGCLGVPSVAPDISREHVFAAADTTLAAAGASSRGDAVAAAAVGAERLVRAAFAAGELDGVVALGGSAGTTIGTAAMRALPLGVPKLMVSTLASGQTRPFVRDKDILMLNPIVDIAGLNRVSRPVLAEAAAALAGMVKFGLGTVSPSSFGGEQADAPASRPLVAASMFGVTTPCVQRARQELEQAGYEVLVFHATGNGGEALESLVADGVIAGVLDITTTELADELVGGVLSAGPQRLTAASRVGVPQVVSVGALDMVNFGPRETVPARFSDRRFHIHNSAVTLMRTTPAENAALGAEIARKVANSNGPAAILLPLRGVSALDRDGQPFNDPEARKTLYDAIRAAWRRVGLPIVREWGHVEGPGERRVEGRGEGHGEGQGEGRVEGHSEGQGGAVQLAVPRVLREMDCHINDEAFAVAAARELISLMKWRESALGGRIDGVVSQG
ncbi:MAG: Tm-1-like ATP-binding domain-containing protein [Planctomycetota bacterium]